MPVGAGLRPAPTHIPVSLNNKSAEPLPAMRVGGWGGVESAATKRRGFDPGLIIMPVGAGLRPAPTYIPVGLNNKPVASLQCGLKLTPQKEESHPYGWLARQVILGKEMQARELCILRLAGSKIPDVHLQYSTP